jgi:hypothetical protein
MGQVREVFFWFSVERTCMCALLCWLPARGLIGWLSQPRTWPLVTGENNAPLSVEVDGKLSLLLFTSKQMAIDYIDDKRLELTKINVELHEFLIPEQLNAIGSFHKLGFEWVIFNFEDCLGYSGAMSQVENLFWKWHLKIDKLLKMKMDRIPFDYDASLPDSHKPGNAPNPCAWSSLLPNTDSQLLVLGILFPGKMIQRIAHHVEQKCRDVKPRAYREWKKWVETLK